MPSMCLVAFVMLGAFIAQNVAQTDQQLTGSVAQENGTSKGEKIIIVLKLGMSECKNEFTNNNLTFTKISFMTFILLLINHFLHSVI